MRRLVIATAGTASHSRLSSKLVIGFLNGTRERNGLLLLARVENILRRYLHLRKDSQFSFIATWAIGTYLYTNFSHYGYLFVHSKFPRSAKTRLLEILSHLCFQATHPLNGPTVPTIRETASEGGTVLLDTLERWKGKSPEAFSCAMEILDAGFRNGGTVAKMISVEGGMWQKQLLPVYAPYALAAIKKDSLADTALDRSFVIEMQRKPIRIKKDRYNFFSCDGECKKLRDDLYIWALQNATKVSRIYESEELEKEIDSLQLNDRAADIWRPIFAVAKALDADDDSGLFDDLSSLAKEMGGDEEAAEESRKISIVRTLRKNAGGNGEIKGTTTHLLNLLRKSGLNTNNLNLHKLLTEWGFKKQSIRLPEGIRHAWKLKHSELEDVEKELSSHPSLEGS